MHVGLCPVHGFPCMPLVHLWLAAMAGRRAVPTPLAIIVDSSGPTTMFTVPPGHCLAEAWRPLDAL